jgi:hypothetical protein
VEYKQAIVALPAAALDRLAEAVDWLCNSMAQRISEASRALDRRKTRHDADGWEITFNNAGPGYSLRIAAAEPK